MIAYRKRPYLPPDRPKQSECTVLELARRRTQLGMPPVSGVDYGHIIRPIRSPPPAVASPALYCGTLPWLRWIFCTQYPCRINRVN